MIRKLSGPQEKYMRLFGSYLYDEEDESNPAGFFIGTSCGKSMQKPTPAQITKDNEQDVGLRYCLVRDSREWNLDDRRFIKPLRLTRRLPSSATGLSADTLNSDMHTGFHATWKRLQDASTRTWSADIVDSTEVLGKIELCLPYIQVCGKLLCEEFETYVNVFIEQNIL